MAQFSEFIKSDLFDTIPTNQLKIRREKQNEIIELTYDHENKRSTSMVIVNDRLFWFHYQLKWFTLDVIE